MHSVCSTLRSTSARLDGVGFNLALSSNTDTSVSQICQPTRRDSGDGIGQKLEVTLYCCIASLLYITRPMTYSARVKLLFLTPTTVVGPRSSKVNHAAAWSRDLSQAFQMHLFLGGSSTFLARRLEKHCNLRLRFK